MRTLIFIILFAGSLSVQSQDRNGDHILEEPNVTDECVDDKDLLIHWEVADFIVSGNCLYKLVPQTDCYAKVGEVNGEVVGIDYSGDYLVLWTNNEEYRCPDSTGVIERFSAYSLLSPFLARPLKSIVAVQGVINCLGSKFDSVSRPVNSATDSLPFFKHEHRSSDLRSKRASQFNGADVGELIRVLRIVNTEPNRVPSLAEFKVSKEDLAEYTRRVKEDLGSRWDFRHNDSDEKDKISRAKEFYLGLLPNFDTVSPNVLRAALLDHYNSWASFASDHYSIEFVNDFNDTLSISFITNGPSPPYMLPWTISYGGVEFMSFNVDLARILMNMLPNNDEGESVEAKENTALLFAIADYLYSKQRGDFD